MKNLILITFLLIPFLGISQTTKPIDGFLGIKFGTSKAEVIAAIKAKGGVLSGDATGDDLTFTGVDLAQRSSVQFMVSFYNDKAYQAAFFFKPDNEPGTIDYYNALVNDIAGVYGKGNPTKTFKSPYEDGDGYEVTALEGGYASFFTDWESDNNLLQATIRPIQDDLYILLFYIDKTIEAQAKAAEKAKDKSSY
jgi:hypothetical protein